MRGTVYARPTARFRDRATRAFERPEVVLGTLVLSTAVTALCTFVVLSNVIDARLGGAEAAFERPTERVEAEPAARIYPSAEGFDLAGAPGFADAAPGHRLPPTFTPLTAPIQRPDIDGNAPQIALHRVIEGRPPVMPLPRPQTGFEVVMVARSLDPARALTLPAPTPRPGQMAVAVSPETPVISDTPDALPTEAASILLAAISPRPLARPESLVVRAPALPSDAEAIEVARAEAPADLVPARLDVPERNSGGLFGGGGSASGCSARQASEIPRRPGNASGGTAVMASLGNGSGSSRDNAIVAEALRGNVPDFLRDLQPVTFTGTSGGRRVEITICVTPDYLAIGSDSDFTRVPLGLPAALRIADAFDMMLPTTTMVDAIYAQAELRLSPRPMDPTSQMSSTDYFMRHDATLDAQFAQAGARPGILVAGHKKDLVLANRLTSNPGRVAIYGWHTSAGNPIQPLSTVHGEYYADYSHGIRLVSRTAFIDGRAVDLRSLLTDERYAGILNNEGVLSGATIRLAAL